MPTKKFVPDTSAIIDGRITELVKSGELAKARIVIHRAVLGELEHQANLGKEIGFGGLEEVKALRELAKAKVITLEYAGERSTELMVKGAPLGEIDAAIRALAKQLAATLITSDKVQAEVARAEGIEVMYFEPRVPIIELTFKKFIRPNTLSLHMKENTIPAAKVGRPGKIKLIKVGNKVLTRDELSAMAKEIVEAARRDEQSYIEIDTRGATVIQLREFRIAIARPPFSDGYEITIIRPITKLTLADYGLSQKLFRRLRESAEGILICGPPGAGKSAFATALAEEYLKLGRIVKTMESPRDLQVKDEITQYAPLAGSFERTADILLLVRPDYCIFDEMRRTTDFQIFTDMRLAGIGMVGVVHSSRPIEAIQRFVGRIDLGMIPQIVDTVIFIKDGKIRKTLELHLAVKVPRGMKAPDLARPVIEVCDFETGALQFEIYKFADETICVPVKEQQKFRKR